MGIAKAKKYYIISRWWTECELKVKFTDKAQKHIDKTYLIWILFVIMAALAAKFIQAI